MSIQDILNLILIIILLIFTVGFLLITYFFVKALKSFTNLIDNLNDAVGDVKEKVQLKFLTAIPSLLVSLIVRFFKRGR